MGITGSHQRPDLATPRMPAFRKAVQEDDRWPIAGNGNMQNHAISADAFMAYRCLRHAISSLGISECYAEQGPYGSTCDWRLVRYRPRNRCYDRLQSSLLVMPACLA